MQDKSVYDTGKFINKVQHFRKSPDKLIKLRFSDRLEFFKMLMEWNRVSY